MEQLKKLIALKYSDCANKYDFTNKLRAFISKELLKNENPVDLVQWVNIDDVVANNYNPNSVATNEMRLLYISIQHDNYTQPIVTIYDKDQKKYVIVDGFHRYLVMKNYKDIAEKCGNRLPVVVLNKEINDRMASTVRHNRARGKHSVVGMSDMVFSMLKNGWADEKICNEIGLEPEELLRLKHITGFSKLFANKEYSKSWESDNQFKLKNDYNNKQNAKTNGECGDAEDKAIPEKPKK